MTAAVITQPQSNKLEPRALEKNVQGPPFSAGPPSVRARHYRNSATPILRKKIIFLRASVAISTIAPALEKKS